MRQKICVAIRLQHQLSERVRVEKALIWLAGLPARRLALHQHGPQALRRAVHRRGEPRGPSADHDGVVLRGLGLGAEAE